MAQLIRTLVVDDSAFVRKAVREMLSRSPYIEVVGAARDGIEALEMVDELNPDVVTCDLTMPRLDGVDFVLQQMARKALPILILSAANEDTEQALQALEAGAVDFVQKPTALATNDLLRIGNELIAKVRAAAQVSASRLMVEPKEHRRPPAAPVSAERLDAVVIGVSTGGPQALRFLIPQLPANFPIPIAMVLHMPVGFTALYAERLDEICGVTVKEAAHGDELKPGLSLLAPAGQHLLLRRTASGAVVAHLSRHPTELLHRPSVDVLFQSAAEVYGGRLLAVVMTGMGDDGKKGCAWIKAEGGTVLTEAEQSCVIYGMPRSVAEAGLSDAAVPLAEMAQAIMDRL